MQTLLYCVRLSQVYLHSQSYQKKCLSYQQSLNPKNPLKVITNPNGADLCAWLIRHSLSISDAKNELLIVSPHYQLSKISIDSITFGDSTIQPVGSVHNLGSQLEAKMAMSVHIAKVCCKALHRLHRIQQIKKFLNPETTTTLTHAFVTSSMDYCNSLLYGIPNQIILRKYLMQLLG